MGYDLSWNKVAKDFGSSQSMANASRNVSEVGNIADEFAKRREIEANRKMKEQAMLQQQANSDRSFGLQEQNASRQAQQYEYNMQMESAKIGLDADYRMNEQKNRQEDLRLAAKQYAEAQQYKQEVFREQQNQNQWERGRDEAGTQLFNDFASVPKTVQAKTLLGKGNTNIDAFNRYAASGVGIYSPMTGNETPEQVESKLRYIMDNYKKAEAKDNEMVANPNEQDQLKKILSSSKASVADKVKFTTILQSGKKDKETATTKQKDYEYLVSNGTPKKVAYKDIFGKSSKSEGELDESTYLLKSMKDVVANDDPEESNDKLITMLPDLQAYAKRTYPNDNASVAFKKSVEDLKLKTVQNRGIISLWDQDVERGGQALGLTNKFMGY